MEQSASNTVAQLRQIEASRAGETVSGRPSADPYLKKSVTISTLRLGLRCQEV